MMYTVRTILSQEVFVRLSVTARCYVNVSL